MAHQNASDASTLPKKRFTFHIPPELRAEFEDRVARENAVRIVYGFIAGALSHFASTWVDWQRLQQGLFDQRPAYRWIFYNHLAWWLAVWVPIFFAWNWSRIRSGQYPVRQLRRLCGFAIVWAWAFPLLNAALNFQYNPALGYYAVVMIVVGLFVLTPAFRFILLLISTVVMCAVVVFQTDMTKVDVQFWIMSIVTTSLLVFVLSSVWYNNVARQFLVEKKLNDQKGLLAEQAELLAAQNQVIETDKKRLADQLDGSRRQLNAFALRLAKKGEFLEDVKTDLSEIEALNAQNEQKKKRLLRKIEQESAHENDWAQFREQFELVHPNFFKAVLAQFPTLGAGDLRLLSLLKMNLDSKEIADILGISAQSLNTARYRLRKNIGLTSEENLTEFVHRFS